MSELRAQIRLVSADVVSTVGGTGRQASWAFLKTIESQMCRSEEADPT